MSSRGKVERVGLLFTCKGGKTRALEVEDPESVEVLRRLFLEPSGAALVISSGGKLGLIDLNVATSDEFAEKALCATLRAQVLSGSGRVQGPDSRARLGAYGAKRAGVDPLD